MIIFAFNNKNLTAQHCTVLTCIQIKNDSVIKNDVNAG